MARREGEVFAFVGDGSYLMLNSELYSAVLAGDKLIVVALRQRRVRRHRPPAGRPGRRAVQQHARGRPAGPRRRLGRARALARLRRRRRWTAIAELEAAFARARAADGTTVIVIRDRTPRLDAGRRVLGGRRAGGERRARGPAARTRWSPGRGQAHGSARRLVSSSRTDPRRRVRVRAASAACTPSCSLAGFPGARWPPCTTPCRRLQRRSAPQLGAPVVGVSRRLLGGARRRRHRHLQQHGHPRRLLVGRPRRGKAIFCEKPISLDLEEVDRGLDAVEAAGVPLQSGSTAASTPAHRSVRDAVSPG